MRWGEGEGGEVGKGERGVRWGEGERWERGRGVRWGRGRV